MLVKDLLKLMVPMDTIYMIVIDGGCITDESYSGYVRDIPDSYKLYEIKNLAALDGLNSSAYINLMIAEPEPVNNVE